VTALIPCLMLPVTAHPEFGLRYQYAIWSYQLKVESMGRLLVVYQIQDMDCVDMTSGSIDFESGPINATSTRVLWGTLRCLCDDRDSWPAISNVEY